MKKSEQSKSGFTLVEILLVIVVISILGGIVMAASSYITRVSRQKRYEVTRTVLKTAIYRYRAEYGDWPISNEESGNEKEDENASDKISLGDDKNSEIFGPLRISSKQNPDHIQFLDESAVFTLDENTKQIIPLIRAEKGKNMPLVYVDKDRKRQYFSVTIDFVNETVDVW